jgi:hypothetical protein
MPRHSRACSSTCWCIEEALDLSSYADEEVAWGGPVDTESGHDRHRGCQLDDEEGWVRARCGLVGHALATTRWSVW